MGNHVSMKESNIQDNKRSIAACKMATAPPSLVSGPAWKLASAFCCGSSKL